MYKCPICFHCLKHFLVYQAYYALFPRCSGTLYLFVSYIQSVPCVTPFKLTLSSLCGAYISNHSFDIKCNCSCSFHCLQNVLVYLGDYPFFHLPSICPVFINISKTSFLIICPIYLIYLFLIIRISVLCFSIVSRTSSFLRDIMQFFLFPSICPMCINISKNSSTLYAK